MHPTRRAATEPDWSFAKDFTAPEQTGVMGVLVMLGAGLVANDADAVAEVFTEDGSLLMQRLDANGALVSDDMLYGRDAIREHMAEQFRGPLAGMHVRGTPESLTFLGDDVALVVEAGGHMDAGETEVGPWRRMRNTWLVVRRDDGWKLLACQSSPMQGIRDGAAEGGLDDG